MNRQTPPVFRPAMRQDTAPGPDDTASRPAPGRLSDGVRVYAVGDVHGRADLLAPLLARIRADAAEGDTERRVVVMLGDYVDRGPQSEQVVDLLLEAIARAPADGLEIVSLMGNHERMLLDFIEAPFEAGTLWLTNGGRETLQSYGFSPVTLMTLRPDDFGALRNAFLALLPDEHLRFYQGLPLAHGEGGYLFVHAGINPAAKLDDQDETDLLWIRAPFLRHEAAFGPIVVHGHSIRKEPEVRSNRIGIDTGAYSTDRLTCLVLEGTELRFL